MIVLGLTGGMGAGKGYVAGIFAEYGVQSIDTDQVSRQVCQPGQPCLAELTEAFGKEILLEDGSLNRKKLAEIAFANEESTALLNKITHKHILSACKAWLKEREQAGDYAAIIDAPLLFESKFNCHCDFVISVIADLPIRLERVIKRDNTTAEAAMARIEKQHTNEFFIRCSDYIVYNNEDNHIHPQVDMVMQQLRFR